MRVALSWSTSFFNAVNRISRKYPKGVSTRELVAKFHFFVCLLELCDLGLVAALINLTHASFYKFFIC